jgi:hypothetical protein
LDGTYTCKSPQVTVRDPGEFLLDDLHVISGDFLSWSGHLLC